MTDRYFYYRVFGLTLKSEVKLPELNITEERNHFDIVFQHSTLGLINSETEPRFDFSKDRATFVYPEVGAFLVEGDSQVWIEPAQNANHNLLSLPLLGPILGLLLHLKGHFVLHGSAIGVNKRGFGFVGDKGAGKSTLGAMLLKTRGTKLLTDDLLAFSNQNEILPAFQQLKLSSEALESAKDLDASKRPLPSPDFPKTQLQLRGANPSTETKLGGLYELCRSSRPRIENLTTDEAIKVLFRFSYVLRFTTRELTSSEKQTLFMQAARLAGTGKVKRIFVPETIEELPTVIDLLLDKTETHQR